MAHEIDLGGTIYISSKHAAEKTGYTQDYIGQLARGGSIEAKRISGMWYILEESLRAYKEKADQFVPTPPPGFTPTHETEVAVSFDGKDYISANRASKLTGYNQDYVGQLARSGQVLSRQVGNRWYIDRESLLAHKAAKDAMLAAVQVESVGLSRYEEAPPAEAPKAEVAEEMHFTYVTEETSPSEPAEVAAEPQEPVTEAAEPVFEAYPAPLLEESPVLAEVETPEEQFEHAEPLPQEVAIPIRVIAPQVAEEVYIQEDPQPRVRKTSTASFLGISALTVVAALGTIAYIGSSLGFLDFNRFYPVAKTHNTAATSAVVDTSSHKVQDLARSLFSKEIVYKRD